MQKIRVFINGFGRIGRLAFKLMVDDNSFEIVGINDIYPFAQMKQLLEYDSVYGNYHESLELKEDILKVKNQKIKLHNISDPNHLVLDGVDILLECSGLYLSKKSNQSFIDRGAKRVIISTPPKDDMPRFIMDINHKKYNNEKIVSNSSCSANAIIPILSIIDKSLDISTASFSMFHSYTAYQKLLDVKHYSKDIRRSRSATQNIEPLSSSAANEAIYFFPKLKDNIYAKSIRVPIKATTLYDLTFTINKNTNLKELQSILETGAKDYDKISITNKKLVSSDFIENVNGAIIDLSLTQIIDGNLIKVFAWQDNEYGYAYQLVRLTKEIGKCLI